ncbi:protein spaetzle 5 isoform X1 [Anastrepha obliqua]|uniref:protein spaetzle 5 isoform X1 n=1 Tax=Anastrepha obliqua TaxID=95512 RepID=UPI002409F358|nr:protein spaetzle 5 isoform X1 [Anastrepha obliqua]XP_054735108.1 protein spaetzle 5 isoform X1 [Anastrepha obliqua]XP_054735109.1 protein spaetzle 5 isoform X1 [Anastrepha obliqua]XP_054735110.1 protein spaetzle 5 isoform X1 [Anastrepha obliqua]XP_054735111.1 protein spaetzle 5 isoform X1 [Anastrepha obliqua]XP_054735112.1 protein spaetzle 5 isoform X1 [Anastrepha obliqua]XP_054735113.1 protein spaetzle 5 isoform X1 [Anastrepha obliqua]
MKSIISRFYSNYGFSFIYVILVYTTSAHSVPSCGLYGAPPCQFVPAPPGQTPSCARPGRTYCEHVDNYPTYLIKHLVHKWGYEAKNLLVDESWDEFSALTWHETPVFYDPAFIFSPQRPYNGGGNGGLGSGDGFNGYKYGTPGNGGGNAGGVAVGPTSSSDNTFIITKSQTTETPTFLFYTSAGQHLNKNQVSNYNLGGNGGAPGSGHKVSSDSPSYWLKRISRNIDGVVGVEVGGNFTAALTSFDTDSASATASRAKRSISSSSQSSSFSSKLSRDVSLNMDLLDIIGANKGPKTRTKRQSPGRETLCKTTSQFITPQAALNNKGNWMFVVNEPSTARQMVKAELCASNTCSNLCQLPNGYNSRCEQKYVQKRLIALQANGQNLYTDSFWFPSCCVCTIAAN